MSPSRLGAPINNDKLMTAIEDMKHLALVIQLYVNETLTDKIRLIKGANKPLEIKMDILEWLSRYARFLSPESAY